MKRFSIIFGTILTLVTGYHESFADGPSLASCTFSFTAPSVNTDGSPLTDLNGYRIKIGTTLGGPYPTIIGAPLSPSTAGTVITTPNFCSNQSNGQKYAVATVTNLSGKESGPSNEVPFVFTGVAPSNPTGLTVR